MGGDPQIVSANNVPLFFKAAKDQGVMAGAICRPLVEACFYCNIETLEKS